MRGVLMLGVVLAAAWALRDQLRGLLPAPPRWPALPGDPARPAPAAPDPAAPWQDPEPDAPLNTQAPPRHIRMQRAIRNRNPGNIRHVSGNNWRGMTGADADGFVVFEAPEWGARAMARVLRNYWRDGRRTIREIVTRYAPANENDTEQYIANLVRFTGWPENHILNLEDDETLKHLMLAMIRMETGTLWPVEQVAHGIDLERTA